MNKSVIKSENDCYQVQMLKNVCALFVFGGPFCPHLTSNNGNFSEWVCMMVSGPPYSKTCLVVLCCPFPLPVSIYPILRVLSFKVFPKCQFHFLVLQIITIPLLIRAVRLRHPSSPLLRWAASSQVQTS